MDEEYKDEVGSSMPPNGFTMEEGDELSFLDEEALLAAPLKVAHILARPDQTRHV